MMLSCQITIYIFFFLLLFLSFFIYSNTVGSVRINVKEREEKEKQVRRVKKRKGVEAQRVKHPTLSRANNALIGKEEQNGK